MPELSAEEVLRYRSSVYGIAATAAFVPKVHLGKNKWALAWEAAHELSKKEGLPPTPAQREAARAVAATGNPRSPCLNVRWTSANVECCQKELCRIPIVSKIETEV